MDALEALKMVMWRVQKVDPENASRIMGYVLIQEQGDKEVMRLAFCPESLLVSYVNRAKACLGIPPHTPSPPWLLPFFPNAGAAFHLTGLPSPGASSAPAPFFDCEFGSGGLGSPGLRGADFSGDGESPAADKSDFFQLFPYEGDDLSLRRSRSLGGDGDEYFLRPCGYFARGHCKNGVSCKFLHTGATDTQREFSPIGYDSSRSRQIYLTFPADSTFTEEDVSGYFSEFGPVQDVRIPYQQKRMFGFVTFVYAETVRIILAKKNPHFIQDCRVLVKPYKEKCELRERKRQQQRFERVPPRLSPTCGDIEEHDDVTFGPGMVMSPWEMARWQIFREQSDLQDLVELQSQRMMNLGLKDVENWNLNSFPAIPAMSPRVASQFQMNRQIRSFGSLIQEDSQVDATNETPLLEGTESQAVNSINDQLLHDNAAKPGGSERNRIGRFLPNSLFASPIKWPSNSSLDANKSSEVVTLIPPNNVVPTPLSGHSANG